MANTLLVIAPHPDDELLGCGGTLLRRRSEGWDLAWMIVTAMSESLGWTPERIRERSAEIERVAEGVGFSRVYSLGLPPARLDGMDTADIIAAMSPAFKDFQPAEVLLPHRGDVHSDHRVVFEAGYACTKWFRYPSVHRVLSYETPSETDAGINSETLFRPNVFVDISDQLGRKLELLSLYRSEMGEHPFPRSTTTLQSLAQWRGASAGFYAAEAFELLRERS